MAWQDKGKYSTIAFADEAVDVIKAHPADPAHPLFMYLAFQAVHAPPEVPELYVPIYGSHIHDHKRANFAGMASRHRPSPPPPLPFSSLAQFRFRQAAPGALPAAAASPRVRHNADRVC